MASFSSTFTAFCASRTKPSPSRRAWLGQRPGGALGLGLLLQKPLLRRLQLVYFFTVQFTHRLS